MCQGTGYNGTWTHQKTSVGNWFVSISQNTTEALHFISLKPISQTLLTPSAPLYCRNSPAFASVQNAVIGYSRPSILPCKTRPNSNDQELTWAWAWCHCLSTLSLATSRQIHFLSDERTLELQEASLLHLIWNCTNLSCLLISQHLQVHVCKIHTRSLSHTPRQYGNSLTDWKEMYVECSIRKD